MRRYHRMNPVRRVAASASLLLAMIAVACSSDDETASTAGSTDPAAATVPATDTAATTAAPTTLAPAPTDATDATDAPGRLLPPAGSEALPAATGDVLQAAIDDWVAAGHLSGITAAVITPDGTWTGAAGFDAAGSTLTADAAMSIMSISKTFTAAEILSLAAEGLVDLDAPLTDYVDLPFDTGGATVRQALAMRTGFPSTSAADDQALMVTDLGRIWTPAEWMAAIPADAERLGELGGTAPRYNSLNYQVLALVVEAVTGTSFAAAVRTDLIEPAGLDRMWVQPEEEPLAPLTVGAPTPWADITDPDGPYLPSAAFASRSVGGGSMAGDALDLARWGYELYGGYVLDRGVVDEMWADPLEEPNIGPYGLGVLVYEDADGVFLGHAGGGTDWPYTGALHVWIGDDPIAIALLTPQPADFGTDIFEVFMQLHDLGTAV